MSGSHANTDGADLHPFRCRWGIAAANLGLLACLFAPFGCSQMVRPEQAAEGQRVEADAFLHEHLQSQPVVTVAEAYRAIIMLADGDDRFATFVEREESLLSRGFVRSQWGLQADHAIDRGSVAYMICRILEIRGGVNREVFGNLGLGDRRYAVRELVYRELMTPGAPYRYLAGGELVDLVARADQYMSEHDLYEQKPVRLTEMLETAGSEDGSAQPGTH